MQTSHQRLCSASAQAANRVNFNQPEEEFLDGDDVVGLGVLGKEGSGQLRAQVTATISAIMEITKMDAMSLQNFIAALCSSFLQESYSGGRGRI